MCCGVLIPSCDNDQKVSHQSNTTDFNRVDTHLTMKTTVLYALLLCSLACCIHAGPDEWTITGKPSPGHEVKLTFAIKQHNPDWLKDKLKAVSYPDSPHYTDYMNFDEIAQYVYGEPESVKVVTEALESMGASKIDFTIGRDFVVALVPFENVEQYFNTQLLEFESTTDGSKIVTSFHHVVPVSLKEHVDFLSGLTLLESGTNYKERKPQQGAPKTGVSVTPKSIDKDYNISGYTSSNANNSQAIAAFLKQYFDASDLQTFQKRFDIPAKPIAKIVGKDRPTNPGIEANLDVQYISATGRNVDTWFISVSTYSNNKQEDFLSWIVSQVNTTNSPWVHSASYGDDESSIATDYLTRVDAEFMKFGISGRTVLFATGDSGVECNGAQMFTPNWPTSSPYITAVGGTISLDTVWSSGGGGFSNYFGMPDYQKDAVKAYLDSGKGPSVSHFNVSGRAYPDVSAFAVNFEVIEYGQAIPVGGTSCAAPTVAGIISILNDVRLNKGQKTLGFLNPLLYMTLKGNGFFDIVNGNNGNGVCRGFEAVKGWDPASGWGSPNFGLLKGLV